METQNNNINNWLAEELKYLQKEEERIIKRKEYYNKNKKEINRKINELKKKNGWKYYQTKESKLDKCIKNKTRYRYPIKNQMCQICFKNIAHHHHHTTKPLEIDKFIFVCSNCHKDIHKQLNL